MRTPAKLAAAFLALLCAASCIRGPRHDGSPLRCAISITGNDRSMKLLCGYNYELATRFARSEGRDADIRLAGRSESILDSLKHGKIDLVMLPYADSLQADSLLVWYPADSCGIWVFAAGDEAQAAFAGNWLQELHTVPEYAGLREPYLELYNPLKQDSAAFISPYDSLVKLYADTLGWDWKMLAALIYQESRFRIEARSPKGASGLMQLVPNTARKFGCDDWLDPEQNIRAGVLMLRTLEKKYTRIAANPSELAKYTLAAYNAGSARIRDCISYARHLGADVSRWENVAAVIPDMKHDSIAALDAIKLGAFHGRETVSYVRSVNRYYERYKTICP